MVLRQRSPVVSVIAFMGLVEGKGMNFHLALKLLLARQTDWRFMYSTSFSPQNNSIDAKRRN